jgi:hypothetical protein
VHARDKRLCSNTVIHTDTRIWTHVLLVKVLVGSISAKAPHVAATLQTGQKQPVGSTGVCSGYDARLYHLKLVRAERVQGAHAQWPVAGQDLRTLITANDQDCGGD